MNPLLPEQLAARLTQPLCGPAVGSRFEPTPRLGRCYDSAPADARKAAVLVLLYPHRNRWHLPLTLRPAHLPDHAGQISLPGGAIEPGETDREAALREFHEELGAAGQPVDMLGRLSTLYVHASHFRIEPWVGVARQRPAMVPNVAEVAALLEVPLGHLLDPIHFGCHERWYQDQPYTAPHFLWEEHKIWGATCMILGELVMLIEESGIAAD
ncbi:MAG: CoA pyrophosphatase [Rhodopirellula sp.]|nr:CoA pyrophosphatase [Rhodopirellula sp.]